MSSEKKKHLHVLIDADLYKTLITLAPELTDESKYRGAVSRIVEDALRLYFSVKHPPNLPRGAGEGAHTHKAQTGVLQGEIKIKQKFNNVLTAYRKIMNYSENDIICEIKESDLASAINLAIGTDKRTFKSWVDKFLKFNLLRKTNGTYIVVSSIPYCVQEEDKQ